MKIFLSPHDDDNVLFGAWTCLYVKPLVVVVTDSFIQPNRGELGCDAETRAKETEAANTILGCETKRLLIPDDNVSELDLRDRFWWLRSTYSPDIVYAPAIQGGNVHHDLISEVAQNVFGERVVFYPTYTKTELYTTGMYPVPPKDKHAFNLKNKALDCFKSQLRINKPHFDAVRDKLEWLC